MKGIRLKILLLTALILTIFCGLMFYRSLFSLDLPKSVHKFDFEELRGLDLQINSSVFYLRKNMNSEISELEEEILRINELMAIIQDLNITSLEMSTSVNKIKSYFTDKQQKLARFKTSLKELRLNVNQLIPHYNDLSKNNIKFGLDKNDKRDFYRECLLDVYMFISFSHKENETRVQEDLKIMSQIITYADVPNPFIVNYSQTIDGILRSVRDIDILVAGFRENGINKEINIIAKSYQENNFTREQDNENFLKLLFAAFFFYLVAIIIILRKN